MEQGNHPRERSSLVERAIERLAEPSAAPTPSAVQAIEARDKEPVEVTAPPPDPAAAPSGRRSKQATIDLDKLRAAGGFSPTGIFTRTTEEFRVIKRTILHNVDKRREEGSRNSNLVMVTSSRQGEGKTFVAINLAMSIAAERDKNVLLIDADLSNPTMLERLGLKADQGLIDVLEDASIDLADVLIRTNVESLTVLPAGRPHPLSTELLASRRMEQFMAELAQRYPDRIILLDAPPVLATSEPAALAMHVGQIVFVVEASKTSQAAIKESLGLISICPDIGFVMNKMPFQFGMTRFGSYYKSYRKLYYRESKRRK